MELRQAPPGGIPLIYPEDVVKQPIPAIRQETPLVSRLQPQSI
jgi:hypothetical protein